jgi:ABC-2 type transport system ATP-binding protein
MRQRLNIARLLIHDPKLMFLDEPTSGLDPRGTREVRELIRSLGEGGKTIFICTHILPEVEMVCQEVGIVNKGRLVALDSPDNLRDKVRVSNIIKVEMGHGGPGDEEIAAKVRSLPWAKKVSIVQAGLMQVEADTSDEKRPELARLLVESGAQLLSMNLLEPTLEDVFMSYTEDT